MCLAYSKQIEELDDPSLENLESLNVSIRNIFIKMVRSSLGTSQFGVCMPHSKDVGMGNVQLYKYSLFVG